jgi:hypothetical protein
VQRIPIGTNGLDIRAAGTTSTAAPAVIARPDFSVDIQAPDDNYGLFFIPAPPTPAELAGITTWKPYDDGNEPFEYAIIVRGAISIAGVSVDRA